MKGHSSSAPPITWDFLMKAALGKIKGVTTLNKYGASPGVDTATDPQDIWDGAPQTFAEDEGSYTFSSTADIDSISSSDVNDDQEVLVIGLDSNWNEVTQTVTLNGQTRVVLGTLLIRVYRAYNYNSTDFEGDVYIYVNGAITAGVPDTKVDIRAKILQTNNQTEMTIYTVPAGKTALFLKGYVGISRGGTSNVAEFVYRVRPFGGVFQTKGRVTCSTQGSNWWQYEYGVPAPVPEKSDIKIKCVEVSANNTGVVGGFDLILFDNTIWNL